MPPDDQQALERHRTWLGLEDCPCPYAYRGTGRLYGISMGKGWVRLSTTPGCPEHDSCKGWTHQRRLLYAAEHAWAGPQSPQCPLHGSRDCPTASG